MYNTLHGVSVSDDDNRIALQPLPTDIPEETEEDDYINAYMGDYINASYIDVSVMVPVLPVCVDVLCDLWARVNVCMFTDAGLFQTKAVHSMPRYVCLSTCNTKNWSTFSLFQSLCLSICLSVCLSVHLSVCLSVCPSVCLSVCLSACLSVCLSVCLSFSYYVQVL